MRLWLAALAAFALYAGGQVLAQTNEARTGEPAAVVAQFHDALLDVWKDADKSPAAERFDRLAPAVKQAFDLQRMMRGAAGSSWGKATPEQRVQLVEAFTRYSVATYVDRFDAYDGQTFQTIGTQPVAEDQVLVETRIVQPSAEPVSLTYVMNREADQWRIVDVRYVYEGKAGNEIPRLHGEFRQTLRTGGPDLLVERLNALADQRLAGTGGQ